MATILLPVTGATLNQTNPPGVDYENSLQILLFDDTTAETCYWMFQMPDTYGSSPILDLQYTMASATSGTVEFEVSVMAVTDGDAADVGTESYDTVNTASATVPGTAGHLDKISVTLTNADSVAAGDLVIIRVSRDADDGTNDTATGDLELRTVALRYTAA